MQYRDKKKRKKKGKSIKIDLTKINIQTGVFT